MWPAEKGREGKGSGQTPQFTGHMSVWRGAAGPGGPGRKEGTWGQASSMYCTKYRSRSRDAALGPLEGPWIVHGAVMRQKGEIVKRVRLSHVEPASSRQLGC